MRAPLNTRHRHKWLVLIKPEWPHFLIWLRRCQTCGKPEGRSYEFKEAA